MAYIITRLCIDCLDKGCVEVCPVDCIYQQRGDASADQPNMLYIHPTECISCSACEPECPWKAIYEDREVPAVFADDAAINALCEQQPSQFAVATVARDSEGRLLAKIKPSSQQVDSNRAKWGAK
ncbi:MAG: ferredoxin family protein [Myxococcales bacterium]|nr:ferredoxin family protein [Myxococcales bacterium]